MLTFQALLMPSESAVNQISDLSPDNPFYTKEYLRVREIMGAEPCILQLLDKNRAVSGCSAFLTRGRLNSRLEITSFPVLPDQNPFWNGLFDFCRAQKISVLSVQTFSSTASSIGETRNRVTLKKRSEYRLDLTVPDLWKIMSRLQHRQITLARKSGLTLRRSSGDDARRRHIELANLSLDRNRDRGYKIDSEISIDEVNAFIDCGSGEIFQAIIEGDVHSTMLVVKSRRGAYAQTSGTSDKGRKIGASHFIFHEISQVLKSEGFEVFNVGGAEEGNKGLQDFKLGLGAKRIDLESAEFYIGSYLRKFATKAISLAKQTS